jgi:hypothetical protein
MADARRVAQEERVIAAARRYRDLMRRYIAEQTAMIDRDMALDDLVMSNWAGFAAAAAAEEELFALLDTLDTEA